MCRGGRPRQQRYRPLGSVNFHPGLFTNTLDRARAREREALPTVGGDANGGSYELLLNFADYLEFNERSCGQNSDTSLAPVLWGACAFTWQAANRLISVIAIVPLLTTDSLRIKHEPRYSAISCFVHDCGLFVALFDDRVQFATIDTSTCKPSPPRLARCPATWSSQTV